MNCTHPENAVLLISPDDEDHNSLRRILSAFDWTCIRPAVEAKEVIHVLSMACRRLKISLASPALKLHGCTEGQPAAMVETAGLAHP
jgi:hypothetical protein